MWKEMLIKSLQKFKRYVADSIPNRKVMKTNFQFDINLVWTVRFGSVRFRAEFLSYEWNGLPLHEHRTTCAERQGEEIKSQNEPKWTEMKWNHHDSNESCKSSAMKLIPTKSIAHAHPFWIRITYHHTISSVRNLRVTKEILKYTKKKKTNL